MKQQYERWFLIAIFIAMLPVIASYVRFALLDQRLSLGQDATYSDYCVDYYDYLKGELSRTPYLVQDQISVFKPNKLRPSLVEKFLGCVFFVFGKSFVVYRLALYGLVGVLLLAVYLFGLYFINRLAGAFMTLMMVAIPGFVSLSRTCLPHFYGTAFILFAIICFAKSDKMQSVFYVTLASVCCAIAILIHYSAVFYIAVILCWIFWISASSFKERGVTLGISFFTASILCFYESWLLRISLLFVVLMLNVKIAKIYLRALYSVILLMALLPLDFYSQWVAVFSKHSFSFVKYNIAYHINTDVLSQYYSLFYEPFQCYFWFGILSLSVIYHVWHLYRTPKNDRAIDILLLGLLVPSIGAIVCDKAIDTHILNFPIFAFFIARFIISLRQVCLNVCFYFLLVLFSWNIVFGVTKTNKAFEFLYPDVGKWGRAEMMQLFQDKTNIRVGVLSRAFLPFISDADSAKCAKVALQILAPNTIKLLRIASAAKLTHLQNSGEIDYLLFYPDWFDDGKSVECKELSQIETVLQDRRAYKRIKEIALGSRKMYAYKVVKE